ncbi:hypothetical protein RHGRI_020816 [Rhododendron griersonianum]|uniref:Uncharacterized protein n=1 Tax=Rhododendron griersonianum TaxID=479676 RepID=A0AAV6JHP1_9ERIC|nr:hypothetical protein RHGRI_020816 [Rhododendron griersonianum]
MAFLSLSRLFNSTPSSHRRLHGISLASPDQHSLENPPPVTPAFLPLNASSSRRLLFFEVVSFSFIVEKLCT